MNSKKENAYIKIEVISIMIFYNILMKFILILC